MGKGVEAVEPALSGLRDLSALGGVGVDIGQMRKIRRQARFAEDGNPMRLDDLLLLRGCGRKTQGKGGGQKQQGVAHVGLSVVNFLRLRYQPGREVQPANA